MASLMVFFWVMSLVACSNKSDSEQAEKDRLENIALKQRVGELEKQTLELNGQIELLQNQILGVNDKSEKPNVDPTQGLALERIELGDIGPIQTVWGATRDPKNMPNGVLYKEVLVEGKSVYVRERRLTIQQILDDEIIVFQEKPRMVTVFIRGVATTGLVDGRPFKPEGVFQVSDTASYKTIAGARKTVFVLEKIRH